MRYEINASGLVSMTRISFLTDIHQKLRTTRKTKRRTRSSIKPIRTIRKEENGSSCGTPVGWTRARQLADREPLSRETIARMASFKRHQQHKDVPYDEGCGGIMWDAWGGDAGVEWAIRKLKQIDGDN